MTAPFADIIEEDNTARVPAGNGIYGYIQIPTPIGPTDKVKLVDSETSLLNWFTVNGKVEVGYDSGFFSALAYLKKSNKLWLKRVVAEDALYGGCVIPVGTSVAATSLSTGLSIPSAYTFNSSGVGEVGEQIEITPKADFNGNLGGKYFVLQGNTEYVWIKVKARSEVSSVTINADIDNSLNNLYFILQGQEHYVWFNVNSAGVDPGLTATVLAGMTGIEIAIDTNSTIATVGAAIIAALTSFGYTATQDAAVLTITRTATGAVSRGNSGNSGFGYVTSVFGLDVTPNVVISGLTGYAAEIDGGANATAIAVAIGAAIQESANFTVVVSGSKVTATFGTAGAQPNAYDGSGTSGTGFSIVTTAQGSKQSGSDAMLIHFQNPCEAAKNFAVKIFNHEDYPEIAPLDGTFVIKLYRITDMNNPIETYTCSRIATAVNAANRNIYVEKVVEASQFIRVIDNTAVDEEELPRSVPDGIIFGGGSDGSTVTTGDMISALEEVRSKEKMEVSILMDGGWSAVAYKSTLDEIAMTRGDCVAITSTPYYLEDSSTYLEDIVNYRKYEYNVNSSYSATYTPHINIYDYFNDRYIYVAPDGYVSGAISDADKKYKIWYPVLGFKRGTLTNVNDVKRKYTTAEMDTLYANQINPIRYIPGQGIVIWGQKTTQVQATDLDRLNVRLLLIAIKPSLQKFLETYIGELNTETNRNNLKSRIDNFMNNIKANDGVYDFKCVCDTTNNTSTVIANNQLLVDLCIKPTKAIEYITMTIKLTPLDVSFS